MRQRDLAPRSEGAPGAILCLTDVTDNVRMREELTAKATYDVLTGCHNRASIMSVLDNDSTALTRHADVAMYRSKQQSDGQPVLHRPSMEQEQPTG